MLIAYWRERLDLAGCSIGEALARMRRHPPSAALLGKLDEWLHQRPGRHVVDVAEILRPYRDHAAAGQCGIGWLAGRGGDAMTFGRPAALLLLAVPVLLVLWETLRQHPAMALPFDHGHQRSGRWLGRLVLGGEPAAGRCCWPWRS